MRLHPCVLLILLLWVSLPALAQQEQKPQQPLTTTPVKPTSQPPKSRLTIGVALEGGGALGEAHVGVLQWFAEHHIPIDYLAGTSMGGLVGGLYATGKSADQLRDLLEHADWNLLLAGATPYQDLSFRRKEDARDIPNSLQIGLKNGATLPAALNSGQQVGLLIDRETLPYSTIPSFDDLPIPFRCVSTDLISGNAYVFSKGSLAEAMRATIAIPGVFAPVRRDNQIFVDGGLVDNLPTDVVRKMGADVVIGVHLQIAPASAKEIQSAFAILARSVELIIADTEIRGMAGADLLVKADVQKFSTFDYEKTDELIAAGYAAAQAKAAVLKPYELDDQAWAQYLKEKDSRLRTRVGVPQFINVDGVTGEAVINVQKFLSPMLGKPIDEPELQQLLTRLTGVGLYDSVTYSMIHQGNQDGLLIYVHKKSYAPPVLRPGIVIDGTQTDDVTFTAGARLIWTDLVGYRSDWRTDFQFGQTYGLASDLYRPFQPLGRWFIDPFVNARQFTFLVYKKADPRADYRMDNASGGADLGYAISHFSEIRAGYGIGYTNEYLRLGTPEFASLHGRIGAFHMRYVLDHTNDPVIPTRGYYAQSNFYFYDTYPAATEAFPSLTTNIQFFQPVHNDSIFVTATGGSTFGYRDTGNPQFFLGGVGRLTAYGLNELEGDQFFVGRFGYLRQIGSLPTFVGKSVYLIGFAEVGKMYDDPLGAPRLSGDGAGGIIADTFVGPIFIGGSAGDSGHHKWFFQLGRVF
jgi:NTE family protein